MIVFASRLSARQRGGARSGFTLIELLAVMTILGILLGLVVPASRSLSESSNITLGGQMVSDELALARQYAASQNQTIEVRFIAANPSFTGYNAVQLWQTSPVTGTAFPVDKAIALPVNVEISSNDKLSPLVSSANDGLAGPVNTMPAGGSNAGKGYVSFTVRATGIVVVSNASAPGGTAVARQPSYFLTVLPNRYDTATSLPPNYLIIQVNPDTAYAGVYQP